jgi:hypothetical protein
VNIFRILNMYSDSTKSLLQFSEIRVIRLLFSSCLLLLSLQSIAQTKVISGVPVYYWRHGCGPTAEGMVLGYYDTHGFPDLIAGDASEETSEVDQALVSDEHYTDYAQPIDADPTLMPDKSELPTGDEHTNNCLADFMGTSQSVKGNYYGWSLPSDMASAWENYISTLVPKYAGTAHRYDFDSFPWDSLVANIDRNCPLLFNVDVNGDGIHDHYVCVTGYAVSEGVKYYNCLNTWDDTYYHWYPYKATADGVSFGISSCYTFEIHMKLPADAGNISGSTAVCEGATSVTYTVPVIEKADSYIWTLPSGFTGSSSTNSITVDVATGAESGNITVKGHNEYGNGRASSLAVTVDILPQNAGTISGYSTVCQGQNSVTYSVSSISGATSYIWTLPSGASGSGTTSSITVDYGTSAVSGTITVKGQSSCGEGESSSLPVTVNPLPLAAGTISGETAVCQGETSVTYTVPAITHATSYTWTLPSGASGSSTTRTISVDYGTSAVSGNITVAGTNSCGTGTSSSFAVTVNLLPSAAGTITGPSTVCQGQTEVTYTVPVITNATSYTWTLPTGASGSSTTRTISVSFGSSAVSGNITVAGNNSCGSGTLTSLGVTVNSFPSDAGTITGTSTICQGQTSITYTVPTITHATSYTWTLPTGASGSSTTRTISVSFGSSAVSGNITVAGNNSCGTGISSSFAVSVNPLPSAAGTITGTSTVCQGQTAVTYSVPTITNATSYTWTLPTGASGSSTTRTISVSFGSSAVSGNITVAGNNSCGTGISSSFTVSVNPLPSAAGTITGTSTVCQGQTAVTYTVPTITHATSYTWTLPTGASGSSTTRTISVSFGSSAVSGNITVAGNNSCGTGTSSTFDVTVNPLPSAAGTITGSSTVCQGQAEVTYTVPAITHATSYRWTLPTGASGTSTSRSITVDYSNSAISGNITVTGISSCGEGTSSSLAITVDPLPVAAEIITGKTTVCQGETLVTYSIPDIDNATSYLWTLPSGASGLSSSRTITVNFGTSAASGNVSVKGINSCGYGQSSSMAIIVNPLPAKPTVSLTDNTLHSDSENGNQWYAQSGSIYGATTQDYSPLTEGNYYVIVTLNGCVSDVSNIINVILTGEEPVEQLLSVEVYPNPFRDELIIEKSGNLENLKFEIYNASGQIVYRGILVDKISVQTSGLSRGLYIIKIENGNNFEYKKVIKN